MKLVKCPRCDLNYITETEKYCKVCLRDIRGVVVPEDVELCSVCNEAPALPGRDVCLMCLQEMNAEQDRDETENTAEEPEEDIDSVDDMEEIIPEIDNEDIPDDIEHEISLDDVVEDEERMADDEDEEEEI